MSRAARNSLPFLLRIVVAIAIAISTLAHAHAADWRIQTKIFDGESRKPTIETTTLFYDARVYDLLASPEETTVFDPAAGKLIVLDAKRKLRTEITTSELQELTKHLAAAASRKSDPLMQFAADPKFETTFSAAKKELTCHSPLLTYEVQADAAPSNDVAAQYQTFADWYARLNAVQPGRIPPHARLVVNGELGRRQLVPTAVRLVLKPDAASKKTITRRSEHTMTWSLSEGDVRLIQAADKQAATYDAVSFARFHNIDSARTASRK